AGAVLGSGEGVARLAELTGRHEDRLALLDVAARVASPLETRREALRRRAQICEQKLGDPERAFYEHARLLALDPGDREALAEANRLAAAKQLWRALDALYAELWDRSTTLAQKIELARARHQIQARELRDPERALDQLLVLYRLDPTPAALEDELSAGA